MKKLRSVKKSATKSKPGKPKPAIRRTARTETGPKVQHSANRMDGRADVLPKESERAHLRAHDPGGRMNPSPLPLTPDLAPESDLRIIEEQGIPGKPFPIAGIGASAGGFEAVSELLKNLPQETGIAFVLVQHLSPDHHSQLSELLGRASSLPVQEVADNTEIKPDHIYVIPPNANLTLAGGRLRLTARARKQSPPMPIDRFFRSLAAEQQDRAIGIVLSGTGTDGTIGLQEIKGVGGITFAQGEPSAKYYGMPGSAIGTGAVDFILSPRDMATELGRLARHPYLDVPSRARRKSQPDSFKQDIALSDNEKEMGQLFRLVRARTGVDFSFYKPSTLKRRIVRQIMLQRMDSLKTYVEFLGKHPQEVADLFNDLLINVTSFFRDNKAFQLLKRRIIPRLMKTHSNASSIRCWVCGCSTGEEAYSLAITFAEYFDSHHNHRPVQIFASDISDQGIARARAGIYPENIAQDVSPERLRRFFTRSDGRYQVNKSIRDMVIFARQNIITDPPISNVDLITCRNVLIYLGPLLQRKVLPIFHYALRPAGFLMLGCSETVGGANDLFKQIYKNQCFYAKKQHYARTNREQFGEFRPRPMSANTTTPMSETPSHDLPGLVDKLVLREYSPAAVVVNGDWDVMHFRGKTGDYLEHPTGAPNLNLLRMARESLALDLRGLLNKAKKNDEPARLAVSFRKDGRMAELVIEVAPFQLAPKSESLFLVMFRPTGHDLQEEEAPHGKGRPGRVGEKELRRMKAELSDTRATLQSIIEEQEANNEELRSANEEIQSGNEELQSTNEELETAKEELQSTNEELTTLNEELQTRNTELSVVLNDFTNLVSSIHLPIIILDEDLRIRRYTPMAERLFNIIPSDTGRRLSDLSRSLVVPDLETSIEQVISNLVPTERDVQDRDGHWWSIRIRPYRTRDNKITGAVIVLIDIDHIRRALDLMLSVGKEPLIVLGSDLSVRRANDSFYRQFHLQPAETEGRFFYEVGQGQWNILKLRELLENILPSKTEIFDYEIEANFGELGPRKMRVNARRFYDEGWGVQTILLGIEDITGRSAPRQKPGKADS